MTSTFYEILGSVIVFGALVLGVMQFMKNRKPKEEEEDVKIDLEGKLNEMMVTMEKQFEAVANKTLVKNSEYIQVSSQRGLATLLTPIMQEMKDYEGRIEKMVRDESIDRQSMLQMLANVNQLHQGFSEDAKKFVISVRGNINALGRLGEDTLQNILDASCYLEGKDYLKQKPCVTSDGGSIKPDFILTLPNGRGIAVDSKLSLDAFMKFIEEPDENNKKIHAAKLVENIKDHLNDLSKKKYHLIKDFQMMDFTIMFVSSEPVISLSLSLAPDLLREALKKNIIIVGPSSMMATIRCLEVLGREQRQAENLQEIALVGKKLYEKLGLFFDRFNSAQDHLSKAVKALDTSVGHLNEGSQSVVNLALKLKELGVASEKELACPKVSKKEEV